MAADPTLQIIVKMKDMFSKQMEAVNTTVRKTTGRMHTAFTKMGTAVSSLKGKIGLLIGAWVSWRGATAAWNAVKTYGKLEAVRTAFGLLRNDVGIAADAMDSWREIVRGTVSDADFLAQANKAMFSGMIKGKKDLDALAYAAFNYGRIMGTDVTAALEQIVQSIAAASPRALRPLGIDTEELFRVAQALKGMPLEQFEKQRIMLDALIEKSKTGFGEISKLQTTINEKVQQAAVHWGNMQENIGKAFAGVSDVNKSVAKLMEDLTAESAEGFAKGIAWIIKNVAQDLRNIKEFGEKIGETIEKISQAGKRGKWEQFWYFANLNFLKEEPPGAIIGTGKATARAMEEMMDAAAAAVQDVYDQGEVIVSAQRTLCDKLQGYAIKTAEAIGEGVQSVAKATKSALDEMWGEAGTEEKKGTGARGGFEAYLKGIGSLAESTARAVTATFEGMEIAIDDFFFDAIMGKMKSFKEYLRAFLADMARAISRFMAESTMRSLFGELTSTGVKGGIFNLIASLFGGAADGGGGGALPTMDMPAPFMQKGGIVSRPQLSWIGEGGRSEAVVPLPDNRSIPVTLKGGTQAPPVNINFHISATDGASVQRMLYQQRNMIKDIIRGALGTDPDFRSAVRAT